MWQIFWKETRSFLSSLMAYLVIGAFLTGIGLFVWIFPNTNVLQYGFADLETLFALAPYVLMFLVPAITMRSFAEEKKTGTIELLMTRPIHDWQIILGKFLAALFLVTFAILPSLVYYFSIYMLGNPIGNIDSAGTFGSYIGLLLLAGVFCATGIFASSLTDNQVVSFVIACFLCFILFDGIGLLANLNDTNIVTYWLLQIGIQYHYDFVRKGLLDARDLVYFISLMTLMLGLTKLVLDSRKW